MSRAVADRAAAAIPPEWQDFLRWHRWRFRVLLARLPRKTRGRKAAS